MFISETEEPLTEKTRKSKNKIQRREDAAPRPSNIEFEARLIWFIGVQVLKKKLFGRHFDLTTNYFRLQLRTLSTAPFLFLPRMLETKKIT